METHLGNRHITVPDVRNKTQSRRGLLLPDKEFNKYSTTKP